jgi:hypothetical protein
MHLSKRHAGDLDHLGRVDIDPQEIENDLILHPEVEGVVVVGCRMRSSAKR